MIRMKIFAVVLMLPCLWGQKLGPAERKQVEEWGAKYIAALNAADSDAREAAVATVFASDVVARVGAARLAAQMEALRKQVGRLDLHHAELAEMRIGEKTSRVLHVYARATAGQPWRDLQFRVEEKAPHRLTQLAFIAEVAEPVYLPNGPVEDASTLEWLEGYIDRLAADAGLSGAVLLAKGSKPVVERYFGFADASQQHAVTRETRFGMASGSKMFTALAAARLVEDGKLAWDDTLAKFFPKWPDADFARKVTLHHLLSHTSGIREYWDEEFHKIRHTITGTSGLLPWIMKAGVAFEPGLRAEYSNSNFALAGLVVEKASGTDFYTRVQDDVLAKAGMTRSGYEVRRENDPRQAQALVRSSKKWEAVPVSPGGRGTAAGGANTTPEDMLRFSRALLSGKTVRAETLRRMTSPKPGREASALEYGYGFELHTQGGVGSYGHDGQASGANFAFRYFPREDLTLVLVSNQDNGAFDDLRRNMVKLVTGAR